MIRRTGQIGGFNTKRPSTTIIESGSGEPPVVQIGPDFGGPVPGRTYEVLANVALDRINLETNYNVLSALTLDQINMETNLGAVGVVSLDQVNLTTDYTARAAVENPIWNISSFLASKDCYADTVALCPTDTNRNSNDIQVSGTVAGTSDGYISFDLSFIPANATITNATITLRTKTTALTSQTINVFSIANGDETWSETTIKCSNRPSASGGSIASFSSGTTNGVDVSIVDSSGIITRLQQRINTNSCTFLLQNAAANLLTTVFESKDEGTNNAFGPRLSVTFTTPK